MFFVVDYSHLSNEQPYILRMQAFLLNIVVKFTSEVARILAQKKNENRNTVSISSSRDLPMEDYFSRYRFFSTIGIGIGRQF
jgi:hypothetical protein